MYVIYKLSNTVNEDVITRETSAKNKDYLKKKKIPVSRKDSGQSVEKMPPSGCGGEGLRVSQKAGPAGEVVGEALAQLQSCAIISEWLSTSEILGVSGLSLHCVTPSFPDPW